MSSAKRIWVMPSLSRSFFMRLGKSKGSSGLAGTTFLILCYTPIFKSHVKLYRSVWLFSNTIAYVIKTTTNGNCCGPCEAVGTGNEYICDVGRSLSPYEIGVAEGRG